MTREERAGTAVKPGYDEDWWVSNNEMDTFVEIPSTINGVSQKTRWWTSYWFNQEPPRNKGYYVWGQVENDPLPKFDSIFDPNQTVTEHDSGVDFWVKLNGTNAPYTAELVLEGITPFDSSSHPGHGYYAVTAKADDFGSLDPNVVLGIFTYQYGKSFQDGPNVHREIDLLETFAGSQQTNDDNNAQFALQPASVVNGKLVSGLRFTIPKGTREITTFMVFQDAYVNLRIYIGEPTLVDMINDTTGKNALANWPRVSDQNEPGHKNERMHINFYVPHGKQGNKLPNSNQMVTITHFQYKSL